MKPWTVAFAATALLASATGASATELKIFTSRAIATVLWEVGKDFERTSGHKLNIVSGFGPVFTKAINAGETFDILFNTPPGIDALIKDGKLIADTRTMLVRSDVGVEVRKGAPKPDISTVDAFRRTLLAAKSITYLPTPGVPQLIEKLGLKDELKAKSVIPETDLASELVAEGKVELGIVVIAQILTTPGVELVGPLPADIKITTSFGGAVSATSQDQQAARDLIAFLKRPETVQVMRAQGMEPLF